MRHDHEKHIAIWLFVLTMLLIVLLLVGCKTPKDVAQTERVEERTEQTDRSVRERDTIIKWQQDSASIIALLECDSLNNVIMRELHAQDGKRIQTNLTQERTGGIKNCNTGMLLRLDCHEDSLQAVITCKDSIITTLIKEKTKESQIQYIRQRNRYDKFTSAGFWILVVLVCGKIALKVYFRMYKR